jgi:hypothetical protein
MAKSQFSVAIECIPQGKIVSDYTYKINIAEMQILFHPTLSLYAYLATFSPPLRLFAVSRINLATSFGCNIDDTWLFPLNCSRRSRAIRD